MKKKLYYTSLFILSVLLCLTVVFCVFFRPGSSTLTASADSSDSSDSSFEVISNFDYLFFPLSGATLDIAARSGITSNVVFTIPSYFVTLQVYFYNANVGQYTVRSASKCQLQFVTGSPTKKYTISFYDSDYGWHTYLDFTTYGISIPNPPHPVYFCLRGVNSNNSGTDGRKDFAYSKFFDDLVIVSPPICTRNYLTSNSYESGYNSGYNTGYQLGNTAGYNHGYNEGFLAGGGGSDNQFFDLVSAVFDAPIKAFSGLFDFEVFGYNMKSVMLSLFTVAVIAFVVKIILPFS